MRERQRQVREDAILDAAHELMVARGYAEMSMDDVAAHVGISKATLYQHFPSKEELVIHVIVRAMRRGEEFIHAQDPALPAIVRLERVMQNAIEDRASIRSEQPMLMPPSLHQHPLYQEQATRSRAALAMLVDAAKEQGDIDPQLATPIIVRVLVSGIRETSYGDLLASGACSPSQLSRTLVTIMFNGIRIRARHSEKTTR